MKARRLCNHLRQEVTAQQVEALEVFATDHWANNVETIEELRTSWQKI